jgi:hypothetical protein
MIAAILANTPIWVWAIFIALLAYGALQMRQRLLTRGVVLLVPAIMIAISLAGTIATFGLQWGALAAWLAGSGAALALNRLWRPSLRELRYRSDEGKFQVPGSVLPLVLMMAIFFTRFAVGVTKALDPALVAQPSFAMAVGAGLGLCSGLFVTRARAILQASRVAPHLSPTVA